MPQTKQYRLVTALLLLVIEGVNPLRASEPAAPFVAGFERLGRHGEIESDTAGRVLLSELSCTACHASADEDLEPKLGPQLNGAGNRLQRDWIARFVANPNQVKPGTTMPQMLNGLPEEKKKATVQALVAFIGAQKQAFPEIKGSGLRPVPYEFWNLGDVQQGRRLFHRTGCVACHQPDDTYATVATKPTPLDDILTQLDPEELEDAGLLAAARAVESIPLGDLAAKYNRKSLTFFLLDPHHVRPDSRMPNLQLEVVEAADVASWLLRGQQPVDSERSIATPANVELVAEGRKRFIELGCVNCHSAGKTQSQAQAKPLDQLHHSSDQRCTGAATAGLPHFSVDDRQLESIKATLIQVATEPPDLSAAKQVQLTMLRLNCLACHERNGQGGVGRYRKAFFETYGNVDFGDEGRLPPPLTGVGRKLRPAWITSVLQGKGSVRAHMRMRMPVFKGGRVNVLPVLLASSDSDNPQASEEAVFGDQSNLVHAGRHLLDTGCIQCHLLRGEAVPGVIGVDLEGIASRVHPQWFHDFLLNPGDLKPHTRMPSFFPGGQSQNQMLLEGNTERQIAAMWVYLKGIGKYQLPAKIQKARSQNYELRPTDRPIVLRTFMEQAGTHAIAVGFAQKVHFAFDAERVRLAHAWRGGFLDAEGTWFMRFAPPAEPLGDTPVRLPEGVALAFLEHSESAWPTPLDSDLSRHHFRGYRLHKLGVPTFLYHVGHLEVEDRIEPNDQQQLIRTLRIIRQKQADSESSLWIRLHTGKTLKVQGGVSCVDDKGLMVSINEPLAGTAVVRDGENGMEWILPVNADEQQTIEVRYAW